MSGLGAKNPAVQHLRRLSRRRSARSDAGSFVIDGPVLVAEAIEAGLHLDAVYVELRDDDTLADDVVAVAERAQADGARRHDLAPRVLSGAVEAVTPQGIAAIASITTTTVEDVVSLVSPSSPSSASVRSGPLVVLVGVADPGNAGTLIRAAEASGARAVVATTGSVDLFAPTVVRASAGSLFRVPVVVGAGGAMVLAALHAAGVVTIGTAVDGDRSYDEADLVGPVALVLGNEAHGLDPAVRAAVSETVAIPMEGGVESLNVAMAGTLVLFEAARQRRRAHRSS